MSRRLLHATERRRTLVEWPVEVDEQLDRLLGQARSAGESASRAQILAALVMAQPTNSNAMSSLLRRYRRLVTTRDMDQPGRTHRPGPRPVEPLPEPPG